MIEGELAFLQRTLRCAHLMLALIIYCIVKHAFLERAIHVNYVLSS